MTGLSAGNVHDAFFKQLMSEPALAGLFLRERLPAEVAALLAEDPPELVPGSFIDAEMAQHHSDLLYRARLAAGGGEALVYVLVEHKSGADPLVGLQLLRYVVRIWDEHVKKGGGRPLPPVIPLVVYHGPRPWTVPMAFAALFAAPPAGLARYLPAFEYALADLGRIEDAALSRSLRLRAFLKALKYALRPDLAEHIEVVLAEAPALALLDVVLVLTYIDRGPGKVTRQQVRDALRRLVPVRVEEIMGSLTQPAFEEGKAQGKAEGKAEGKADALNRLLTRRFGALPDGIAGRIAGAEVAMLDQWLDEAFDAPDLDAIFGRPASH